MFIVPSVDDRDAWLLSPFGCWWKHWSIGREADVDDSTGEGQDGLRSLKTIPVRKEQSKHRSTYLSLLVDFQPKRTDAIDHRGHLETMRQDDSD